MSRESRNCRQELPYSSVLLSRTLIAVLSYGFVGYTTEQFALLLALPLAVAPAPRLRAVPARINSSRLHHCAVATDRTPSLESFLDEAARFGDLVEVLGHGDANAAAARREGRPFPWGVRLKSAYEKAQSLPPDDLLLMTDAFDVFVSATPDEILDGYAYAVQAAHDREPVDSASRDGLPASRPVTIIIGAESGCWPDETAASQYPDMDRAAVQSGGHAFVNGGCYMGEAKSVAAMLAGSPPWSVLDRSLDDQRWLRDAYFESRKNASLPRIALDHHSHLCMNMHGSSLRRSIEWDRDLHRWRNKATGAVPRLFHMNGDKFDINTGLARLFFSGRVCFSEQLTTCSAVGLSVSAIAVGMSVVAFILCSNYKARQVLETSIDLVGVFLVAGSSILFRSSRCGASIGSNSFTKALSAITTQSVASVIVKSLVSSPLLFLFFVILACPLCSRPTATPFESGHRLAWPPVDLLFGRGLLVSFLSTCCSLVLLVLSALWPNSRIRRHAAILSLSAALGWVGGGALWRASGGPGIGGGCGFAISLVSVCTFYLM